MKVKDIYSWTNITDSGCDSKISRFNDILSSFAMEVYDFYPRKIIERFVPADCKGQITTTYPIAKVRGFFGKWCNTWCSLDPKDCCAWYRRLLMEEMYGDNLDQNSYAIVYGDWWDEKDKIIFKLPAWLTDAFVVYSKGFSKVIPVKDWWHWMDTNIDIDRYTLSLLRLYMKSEYALESENDINMSANYYSRFQTKLKRLKEMYDNNIKFIVPWALNAANK